jgi:hypothetical protein
VVELVDTQVSGICARKGVGVRVPPFALYIFALVVILGITSGCGGKGRAVQISDRANEISVGALDVLEKHVGDLDGAMSAMRAYVSKNREEILGLRRALGEALKELNTSERSTFETAHKTKREALNVRSENLLRTFDEHLQVRRVLKLVY